MTQPISGQHGDFKTKAALKAAVKEAPDTVYVGSNSLFGGEYTGNVADMPEGKTLTLVGPSAYDRKWYANITRKNGVIKVS